MMQPTQRTHIEEGLGLLSLLEMAAAWIGQAIGVEGFVSPLPASTPRLILQLVPGRLEVERRSMIKEQVWVTFDVDVLLSGQSAGTDAFTAACLQTNLRLAVFFAQSRGVPMSAIEGFDGGAHIVLSDFEGRSAQFFDATPDPGEDEQANPKENYHSFEALWRGTLEFPYYAWAGHPDEDSRLAALLAPDDAYRLCVPVSP